MTLPHARISPIEIKVSIRKRHPINFCGGKTISISIAFSYTCHPRASSRQACLVGHLVITNQLVTGKRLNLAQTFRHFEHRAADVSWDRMRSCFVGELDGVVGGEIGIGVACVVNTGGVIFAVGVIFFVGYGEVVAFGVFHLIDGPSKHLTFTLGLNTRIACETVFHNQARFGPHFKGFWATASPSIGNNFGKRFVLRSIDGSICAIISLCCNQQLTVKAKLVIIVKIDPINETMLRNSGWTATNG